MILRLRGQLRSNVTIPYFVNKMYLQVLGCFVSNNSRDHDVLICSGLSSGLWAPVSGPGDWAIQMAPSGVWSRVTQTTDSDIRWYTSHISQPHTCLPSATARWWLHCLGKSKSLGAFWVVLVSADSFVHYFRNMTRMRRELIDII